jgi:hypothetical protein
VLRLEVESDVPEEGRQSEVIREVIRGHQHPLEDVPEEGRQSELMTALRADDGTQS